MVFQPGADTRSDTALGAARLCRPAAEAAPIPYPSRPCGAEAGGELVAELFLELLKADVFVVTALGLGRGREDRICEALALPQTWRHLLAGQRVRVLVLLPRAPREVSADHALEIDALGFAHDHEPAGKAVAMIPQRGRQVGNHSREEVVLLERVGLR